MSRFVAGSSPLTGSMLGPLRSDGTAIGAIRSPPGVIGSNLMSPRRRRRCRDARREGSSGPYRKFSTTVIATLAGQQEKAVVACAVGASLYSISEYQGRDGVHGTGGVE